MSGIINFDYINNFDKSLYGEFNNGKRISLFQTHNLPDALTSISLKRFTSNWALESEINISNYYDIIKIIGLAIYQDESIIFGTENTAGINLVKLSPTNTILWSKTFSIPEMGNAYNQHKIISDANGGSFLMLSSGEFLGIIKIDTNGNIIWSKKIIGINSSGKSPGFDITKNNIGGVVCTLKDDSYQSVVNLDSNGDLIWGKTFVDWSYRWPLEVTTTSSGEIIVAGHQNNNTIYINKLSNQGDLIFAKNFENNNLAFSLIDLKLDLADNSIAILLDDYTMSSSNVIKFDSNGNYLWNEGIHEIIYGFAFSISENYNLNYSAINSFYEPVFVEFNGNLGSNCNTYSNPAYNFVDDTTFINSIISDGANINDLIVNISDITMTSNTDHIYTETNFCEYFGINEIDQTNEFSIYPNPTSSNFTIESDFFNSQQTIELQDNTGRVLMKLENLNQSVQINASSFKTGIYFVVLKNNNETLSSKRLVIN